MLDAYYRGDVDWFKIDASYKGGYTFELENTGNTGGRLSIVYYKENGTTNFGSVITTSKIKDYRVLEKGTYYIAIQGYDNRVENYNIKVTRSEEDPEGGNKSEAKIIKLNESYSGIINYKWDEDWLKLEVPDKGDYTFELENTGSTGGRVAIIFYKEDGTTFYGSISTTTQIKDYKTWEKGTYYLAILAYDNPVESYKLTVSD